MRERLLTVAYMAGLAAVFTAGVSAVYLSTRERVELNRELAEKRVVLEVLGIDVPARASPRKVAQLYGERVERTEVVVLTGTGPAPVLAGRSAEGRLLGYAFRVAGQGFWDTVRGYMAVAPDLEEILGVSFYEQSETPGLGAEITKPWFEQQFQGREIPPEPGPDGLYLRLVRPGVQKGEHDVDAVTGATGTSTAVERMINDTLRSFLSTMRQAGGTPAVGRS